VQITAAPEQRYAVTSPVRTDETATATFVARPGARAWLLVSAEPTAAFVPRWRGALHALRPEVHFAGVLDASGQLTVQVPLALPAGDAGRVLYLQALFHDAVEGFTLSSPAVLTVLDPQF
jgi:hypothetical protein